MKRLIALTAVLAAGLPTTALGAAARKTTGVVYAHVTHQVGNDLYVAGDVKDSVLGRAAIVYLTKPGARPDGSIFIRRASSRSTCPAGR